MQRLDPARFADALKRELDAAEVSPDRPLVLLIPYGGLGGLNLPRMIASRTNRETWSFSGPLAIESDVSGNGFITTVADQSQPKGAWIRSTPDVTPADTDNFVMSIDGHLIPDRDIWAFPIPGSDHRSVGHSVHTPPDQAAREKDQAHFEERTWFNDFDEKTFEWFGKNAYFYSGHGAKESTVLMTDLGQVSVGASEFAHYLKRRKSLSALSQGSSIVLVSCFTGAAGSTVAQTVADVTGRRTYAPTAEVFESLAVMPFEDNTDGQFLRFDPQSASPFYSRRS
ncbi:hypothetical protein OG819_55075 [Streptomyces sp. NBC_01549]|uniref:hypothetical protein n=1 Tax=Streptomyces sp. NBC_01549 TaxID=2975874 RepID=UPI0022530FFF|nr:hypothetical protein [Streptomyces sp. NBC_01549]MCX4598283.1 hypothetical protein [Streptomyces sp. NBC_01549]